MRLPHLLPALATAFDRSGSLDLTSCRRLFGWAASLDVEAHFVAGTTGEFIALSDDERIAVITAAIQEIGSQRVFAHVGAGSTYEAVRLAERGYAIGARRFAAVTPYYSAVSQSALVDYYAALRGALIGCDLFAYVFPARTGVEISPEDLAIVVAETELDGVKVSVPGTDYVHRLVKALPENAIVYSGNDALLPEVVAAGGSGVVSGVMQVGAHPFLRQAVAMREGNSDAVAATRSEVNDMVATFGPSLDATKIHLVSEGIFESATVRIPQATGRSARPDQ